MNGFLKWFFVFMSSMLAGFGQIFKGLWNGIKQIFNIKNYIRIFKTYSADFGALGWILSVLAIIVVVAIFVLIIFMIVLAVRKYIRFRHSIVSNEDLIEEISDLQRQVVKMTKEKDEIMAMKVAQLGVYDNTALAEGETKLAEGEQMPAQGEVQTIVDGVVQTATKLIILQGISGTGKTSLPYSFGKFLQKDTTIASVQPSWRDRTELFGYFNEFTKNFNETEVLKRIYSSEYNDDVNFILLDEMNIARVEYYFAEMLSILEMPDPAEWELDLVPNVWSTDPVRLDKGKLRIPQNIWYIGTANNDDSTFTISDKVYDRAQPINLDAKGVAFDAPDTPPMNLSFEHLDTLFKEAFQMYPVSQDSLKKIQQLDLWVIEKLRVAFGNRILKQMNLFVPVYVACGGEELDGIDYVLATKIFRKFESLNLAMLRDELKELCIYMLKLFGRNTMKESIAYLERLQKLY